MKQIWNTWGLSSPCKLRAIQPMKTEGYPAHENWGLSSPWKLRAIQPMHWSQKIFLAQLFIHICSLGKFFRFPGFNLAQSLSRLELGQSFLCQLIALLGALVAQNLEELRTTRNPQCHCSCSPFRTKSSPSPLAFFLAMASGAAAGLFQELEGLFIASLSALFLTGTGSASSASWSKESADSWVGGIWYSSSRSSVLADLAGDASTVSCFSSFSLNHHQISSIFSTCLWVNFLLASKCLVLFAPILRQWLHRTNKQWARVLESETCSASGQHSFKSASTLPWLLALGLSICTQGWAALCAIFAARATVSPSLLLLQLAAPPAWHTCPRQRLTAPPSSSHAPPKNLPGVLGPLVEPFAFWHHL